MRQMFSKGQLEKLIRSASAIDVRENGIEEFINAMKENPYKAYIWFDCDLDESVYILMYNEETKDFKGYNWGGSQFSYASYIEEDGYLVESENYGGFYYMRPNIFNLESITISNVDNYTLNYNDMSDTQKDAIVNIISKSDNSSLYPYIMLKFGLNSLTTNIMTTDNDKIYIVAYGYGYKFFITIDKTSSQFKSVRTTL